MGQDIATLEVVMEAAGSLIWGQVEGLGALLGGWAEPVICSCYGSAAGGDGYLATPPIFASCS